MTVAELIEALAACHPDAPVSFECGARLVDHDVDVGYVEDLGAVAVVLHQ